MALAWGGPAAWPWSLIWGIALLVAVGELRTWIWCGVLIVAGAFIVKPSGVLALPLQSAPYVLGAYALAIVLGFFAWRHYSSGAPPTRSSPRGFRTEAGEGPADHPRESALVKP